MLPEPFSVSMYIMTAIAPTTTTTPTALRTLLVSTYTIPSVRRRRRRYYPGGTLLGMVHFVGLPRPAAFRPFP